MSNEIKKDPFGIEICPICDDDHKNLCSKCVEQEAIERAYVANIINNLSFIN